MDATHEGMTGEEDRMKTDHIDLVVFAEQGHRRQRDATMSSRKVRRYLCAVTMVAERRTTSHIAFWDC